MEYGPVLSRLISKTTSVSLGNRVDAADFKDELTIAFKDKPNAVLTVILIKQSVTSDMFANQMKQLDQEKDVVFQPQVQTAYAALVDYLASHKNVQINTIEVDNVQDGFEKFV